MLCTNTMHKLADELEAAVDIPLLHIADATAAALRAAPAAARRCWRRGSPWSRTSTWAGCGSGTACEALVPDEAGRTLVHDIIYKELCRGVVRPESKAAYLAEIERLRSDGADGVILGCTEIAMLIGPGELDLPVFDTTRLHAEGGDGFRARQRAVGRLPRSSVLAGLARHARP